MNREEAIKHLETYSTTLGSGQTTQAQHEEAKRIAIKALEQEPTKEEMALLQKWRDNRGISMEEFEDAMNTLEQEPCDNAIDRAEAIKVASGYCHPANVANELAKLPPVNPQPCEEAISRQAVLDALYALCDTGETLKENPWRDNPYIDAVIETIEELPSVTPQPQTGYWEWMTEDKYRCSNCNYETRVDECMNKPMYDFCPFCGVKMVQESEEV